MKIFLLLQLQISPFEAPAFFQLLPSTIILEKSLKPWKEYLVKIYPCISLNCTFLKSLQHSAYCSVVCTRQRTYPLGPLQLNILPKTSVLSSCVFREILNFYYWLFLIKVDYFLKYSTMYTILKFSTISKRVLEWNRWISPIAAFKSNSISRELYTFLLAFMQPDYWLVCNNLHGQLRNQLFECVLLQRLWDFLIPPYYIDR